MKQTIIFLRHRAAEFILNPSNRVEVSTTVKLAGRIDREGFSMEPSEALEQLMSAYGNIVLRTAYFYMKDRHMAEDISQEVFIRVYRNWSSFRGESSVKTWLTRITLNLCRDKTGLKMFSEQPTDPGLMERSPSAGVEEEVLKRLSNSLIFKHVLKLSQQNQEVLYLYYYLDMNTREIAEATAVSEGTIRGRLHRARQQLEDYLRKEGLDS
ncbi:sigma-70 family RNA polymerase sigma factor [Paenibacillus harenae]|uniref:sigma-70 family RNA polymerase sigma factor n=1 Tax=Paenibacillus harenae TaxID=306543 RepID=UPI001FE2038C|nr:sigma-70 family RNA polymerase sigma factor [Paenibacillus harenae]